MSVCVCFAWTHAVGLVAWCVYVWVLLHVVSVCKPICVAIAKIPGGRRSGFFMVVFWLKSNEVFYSVLAVPLWSLQHR